jgi:hypothetical protein
MAADLSSADQLKRGFSPVQAQRLVDKTWKTPPILGALGLNTVVMVTVCRPVTGGAVTVTGVVTTSGTEVLSSLLSSFAPKAASAPSPTKSKGETPEPVGDGSAILRLTAVGQCSVTAVEQRWLTAVGQRRA